MTQIAAQLELQNYIAHPLWPESHLCIQIEKTSGMNRQRSETKRLEALQTELDKRGITMEQYRTMKAKAEQVQWYYSPDGTVMIPRHHIAGALVHAVSTSPRNLRGHLDRDNLRALVQIGDFKTDRPKCDGVFTRLVPLPGKTTLRSVQSNEFIGQYLDTGTPFLTDGVLRCEDEKTAEMLHRLMQKVVSLCGIGASRRMGFGRGRIVSWEVS